MSKKEPKAKIWRTVKKRGRLALRSPSGAYYYGTAAEIRDAALMPHARDMLARSMRLARSLRRDGVYSDGECREIVAAHRREAVQFGAADARRGVCVEVPAADYIMLVAGARMLGYDDFDDFLTELWRSERESFLDFAASQLGKREVPMTRQERRAFERLRKGTAAA